jgi:hypothetical protein
MPRISESRADPPGPVQTGPAVDLVPALMSEPVGRLPADLHATETTTAPPPVGGRQPATFDPELTETASPTSRDRPELAANRSPAPATNPHLV